MSGVGRVQLLIGLSIALLVLGQFLLPGFLSLTQVANQLRIAAFLGLFGLCQTVVIAAGGQGLDLSVGAVATLGGVLGAGLLPGIGTVPAAIVAMLAGLLVGAFNGIGIVRLGVPPLVATLTVASVVNGALIVGVSLLAPQNAANPALVTIAGRSSAGLPNIVLAWGVVTAIALWLFARSAWGSRLRATGANRTAALLSGTDVTAVRVVAYTISGGLAAISGFLLTGYVGQAFLGLGNAYVLTSIVAAAIGGVSLDGGRAPYLGVACAAVMMTVLVSVLTAINIGESGRQIIFGLTLLGFLLLDRSMRRPV
jgi:ribose transport system permease protein